MKTKVFLALVIALFWTLSAAAQQMPQMQPVIYLADFHVKPGKEADFMDLVKKYDEPLFNKLMAEGAVMAWGVDVPILHEPGGASHTFWWVSPDMGAFDKVFAAFEEHEKQMKADDTKAAEEARKKGRVAPKTAEERFLETVDISKHKDLLLRDLIVRFTDKPRPENAPLPYTWITTIRVKPGKGDDFRAWWEKYVKPVLDKLVDDGTIIGYEFGVEEAKTTDMFTHFGTVLLPNLAAREKVRNTFYADRQGRSAEEREHITNTVLKAIDPDASRNFIVRSIALHVAAPPKK